MHQKRKRGPKTCSKCRQVGHDKRMCPQLEKTPPPAVIVEDVEEGSDDNESVTSSVRDVEWDDDASVDNSIDEDVPVSDVVVPLVVEDFPPQIECESENEWEDCPMNELLFTTDGRGNRKYALDNDRPEFDASRSGIQR